MKGPPGSDSIEAVPSRIVRADWLVEGRAVFEVRGVRKAFSIVPGLAVCVPGRTTPLTGRPV